MKKMSITYQGKPITEGMSVRFRNGRHGREAIDWQPYQEGTLFGIINRTKPIREFPAGTTDFSIEGADIDFRHDTWTEQFKTYDGEDYVVEIPDLVVTTTIVR